MGEDSISVQTRNPYSRPRKSRLSAPRFAKTVGLPKMISALTRKILRALGIIIHKKSTGVFLSEDDLPELMFRLCNKRNPRIVDGGSHQGKFVIDLRRLAPDAEFLCFEPQPELYAFLSRRFADDPAVTVVEEALGKESGTMDLHCNEGLATSSFLEASPRVKGSLGHLLIPRHKIKVNVSTLDEALARHRWDFVDIIKLDLQGSEYSALVGASSALGKARVVAVEVWFAPLYQNVPDYLSLAKLMENRGFRLFSLSGLHYSMEDRLLWADAIFVREDSSVWKAAIRG